MKYVRRRLIWAKLNTNAPRLRNGTIKNKPSVKPSMRTLSVLTFTRYKIAYIITVPATIGITEVSIEKSPELTSGFPSTKSGMC